MTDNAADSLARADHAWRTAFTALIAGAVAIAFAPIFVRLSDLGPTATAFWRVALAAPVLLVWMSAVGTAGSHSPRATTSIRAASTPSAIRASRTASPRRRESSRL